jgi:hypothetical protein
LIEHLNTSIGCMAHGDEDEDDDDNDADEYDL